MEQTSRAASVSMGNFSSIRAKALRGMLLVLLAFLAGRAPVMGDLFPAAIGLTACMVSKNTLYVYLVLPAGAGIYSCIARGCDSWGELAALCVCALILVSLRRIKLRPWHVAVVAGAVGIICASVYRLATNTVYKTDVWSLLLEGFLIFAYVLLSNSFLETAERREADALSVASLTAACLLVVCGAGGEFILWAVIIFLALGLNAYEDMASVAMCVVTAGLAAFLVDETQWGFMVSLIIASCAAQLVRHLGTAALTAAFTAVCLLLNLVEEGLILGVDVYMLIFAAAAFAATSWKFGERLRSVLDLFAGRIDEAAGESVSEAEGLLELQAAQMEELADLYATYLDRRSVLATQFGIAGQILEETNRRMQRRGRAGGGILPEKFEADIAVSQCAAAGAISGDCCGWQDLGDGRAAMLISDGMGKGKKAATESLMVTRTILGLLRSGADTELTLKMINTIMMMKEDEDSFATVDLIVLDRKTGRAKFYKIGAAPTLIRRRNNVEEVKLSAVPLGIVNGLKIRYVEIFLKKGDYIIMMSDGVSDGGRGRNLLPSLKETVREIRASDPQTMCDLILNQAADSYLGGERDDLTVMVAKLV